MSSFLHATLDHARSTEAFVTASAKAAAADMLGAAVRESLPEGAHAEAQFAFWGHRASTLG